MSNFDKKVLILDFDGTLADIMPLIHQIAKKYGIPEISDEQLEKMRGGTIRQALKEVNIKSWQLPGLLNQARKIIYNERANLKLFKGSKELVKEFYNDNWDIYILSTNRIDTIDSVLAANSIRQYVTILKRPSFFGKAGRIKALVKKQKYNKKNIWFVGDETRDIIAANNSGINSIAVNWGLQNEKILSRHNPNYIVGDISTLRKILKDQG